MSVQANVGCLPRSWFMVVCFSPVGSQIRCLYCWCSESSFSLLAMYCVLFFSSLRVLLYSEYMIPGWRSWCLRSYPERLLSSTTRALEFFDLEIQRTNHCHSGAVSLMMRLSSLIHHNHPVIMPNSTAMFRPFMLAL